MFLFVCGNQSSRNVDVPVLLPKLFELVNSIVPIIVVFLLHVVGRIWRVGAKWGGRRMVSLSKRNKGHSYTGMTKVPVRLHCMAVLVLITRSTLVPRWWELALSNLPRVFFVFAAINDGSLLGSIMPFFLRHGSSCSTDVSFGNHWSILTFKIIKANAPQVP